MNAVESRKSIDVFARLERGITGDRLSLVPNNKQHLSEIYQLYSNAEALRFWGFLPFTQLEQAKSWVEQRSVEWQQNSTLNFAILRNCDGAFLGNVALYHFHWQCERADIGYILHPNYWGNGYMEEALRLLLHIAFEHLFLHRIEADVDPENKASLKLLEKLGFKKEGFFRERWLVAGKRYDSVMFGLLTTDYEI